MPLGYKARKLQVLDEKGLPTLSWCNFSTSDTEAILEFYKQKRLTNRWAIRTDAPVNTGELLPLFGSKNGGAFTEALKTCATLSKERPELSFILSEAPDDRTRLANIVCQMDDDVLIGELSTEPLTLRTAWIAGQLIPFLIDGSLADYIRNTPAAIKLVGCLRRLRTMLYGEEPEFEVTILKSGRAIFWQELKRTASIMPQIINARGGYNAGSNKRSL